MKKTIQIMKKVTLILAAGSTSNRGESSVSPASLEFIYGVAPDGLCPFESALYDKSEGERLLFSVPAVEGHTFFGHIFPSLRQARGLQIMPETIHVSIEVISVIDAENREVVQALAKAVAQAGCGGSCGCGC